MPDSHTEISALADATKPSLKEHVKAYDYSTRSVITFVVIVTVCYMSISGLKIEEPLYTLAGLIVGFYFGQGPTRKPTTNP